MKKLRKESKFSFSLEVNEFVRHFESILNKNPSNANSIQPHVKQQRLSSLFDFLEESPENISPMLNEEYTPSAINKVLSSLRNGKSSYKDGVLNEVLKYGRSFLSDILAKLFNLIENSGYFPKVWRHNFLVPLYKKGGKSDPSNYRGLAVSSNLSKAYTKSLTGKLTQYCDSENILSQFQFGFRADYRTSDAIFVLKSILSSYKSRNKKPVFSCFVDFQRAFDSISRDDLLYKLGVYGIKGNKLKLLRSMYSDISYSIKSNGEYSALF